MKSWILAARPKTLPAAVVPVWVGALLVSLEGEILDSWLLTCTFLGAIFIQIATNFFNDAIDARKGADTDARLGPVRATASGRLSEKLVMAMGGAMLLGAAFFGWFIFQAGGWPMLCIGLISFFFAFGYTGGPFPLAYLGLGELFVVAFFGLIAVGGTYYVQQGQLSTECWLAGAQVGLLSSKLNSINNLRDREEDAGSNKRTLAVRLGHRGGLSVIVAEVFGAAVLSIFWFNLSWPHRLLLALPILLGGGMILNQLFKTAPGKVYNRYLAFSALVLISYPLTLTLIQFLEDK